MQALRSLMRLEAPAVLSTALQCDLQVRGQRVEECTVLPGNTIGQTCQFDHTCHTASLIIVPVLQMDVFGQRLLENTHLQFPDELPQ